MFLSKTLGWGKFELIRPSDEFSPTGGLFELVEVRSADSEPPESVTVGSNVLWRLPEALGVLNQSLLLIFRYICDTDYILKGNNRVIV